MQMRGAADNVVTWRDYLDLVSVRYVVFEERAFYAFFTSQSARSKTAKTFGQKLPPLNRCAAAPCALKTGTG